MLSSAVQYLQWALKIKEAEPSAPQRACVLAERVRENGGPTSSQVVGEATMSNTWDHKGRKNGLEGIVFQPH